MTYKVLVEVAEFDDEQDAIDYIELNYDITVQTEIRKVEE